MTLLRLNRVRVHVANPDASGSAPAPDGLNVWLDIPGGPFEFNAYVVRNGHLDTANGGGSGQLDTTRAYWSVWSTQPVTVGSRFEPIAGFGYPLPARFRRTRSGITLVLPNTRSLTIYYYNLTEPTQPAVSEIDSHHQGAIRFYDQLHVRLTFTRIDPPNNTAPLELRQSRDSSGHSRHDLTHRGVITNPDLTAAAWSLPPRRLLRRALVCYWVENFVGMRTAGGNAWPHHQITSIPISLGEVFQGPPCSYFFMRRRRPPRVLYANSVSHEIAHCLMYEPGLGRANLRAARIEGAAQRFVERLGLGRDLYGQIFQQLHAPASIDNLMGEGGGTPLLPWQVALMRASTPIGDGP